MLELRALRLAFFLLLLHVSASAQSTFKESLGIANDEPNTAHKVAEYNGDYYINGNYFDQKIGYWTAFYAIYDNEGNKLRHITEKVDTIPDNLFGNDLAVDESGLYHLGHFGPINKIAHYNIASDSMWVVKEIDIIEADFLPLDMIYDEVSEKFILTGRNFNRDEFSQLKLMSFSDDETNMFCDSPSYNISVNGRSLTLNSKNEIVVLSSKFFNDVSPTKAFITILDTDLNLISSTNGTADEITITPKQELSIDHEDNILITGVDRINDTIYQMALKLDPQGKLIWKSIVDYNHNNYLLRGSWGGGMKESHEKDGYILAGSEAYQNDLVASDTLIVKAAIAKVDTAGNELWYRTYTFRTGPKVSDIFDDFELTSDGGYIFAGNSADFTVIIDGDDHERLPWIKSIILKTDSEGRIDMDGTTNISITSQESITVYPNPVVDRLSITQDIGESLDVLIYDMSGNLMDEFQSSGKDHTIVMDVHDYSSGSYSIISRRKDGRTLTTQFVKL